MRLPDGFRRLLGLPRDSRREVRDEFRDHIEQRVEELTRTGLSAERARSRARAEFGDLDRIARESVVVQRQIRRREGLRVRLESWLQDLRAALRGLAASPVPSLSMIAILALGIGAVTGVFGVVNAIFLKPLSGVQAPDRLIEISQGRQPGDYISLSYPVLERIAQGATSRNGGTLESVAGFDLLTVAVSGEAATAPFVTLAMQVSGGYFRVIGVAPGLGRLIDETDAGMDGRPVTVLSNDFWRRRYDADPDVIGRTIRLNGAPVQVVGVTAPGFHGHAVGARFDLWVPLGAPVPGVHPAESLRYPRNGMLDTIARLAPGATVEAAREQVDALADGLVQETEGPDAAYPLQATRHGNVPGPARLGLAAFLAALFGITGVVLAITCVNVTNLQLARAFQRRREMAIRASLGAGRARLVRQLVVESLLLFGAGACLGTWLATAAVRWASSGALALPVAGLRIALDFGVDLRILLFSTLLTLAVGVISGLVPALYATRADLMSPLRAEGRESGGRFRLREWMVGIQVAATLVLLVVSGLFVRSLHEIGSRDLGFRSERVRVASLDLQLVGLDAEGGTALWQELLASVRALPAIESASLGHKLPLSSRSQTVINAAGVEPPEGQYGFLLSNRRVSDDYFETLGMPLVRGRAFDGRDRPGSPPTIILNETMAERLWPGEDPIGRQVYRGPVGEGEPMEVVGIARDGVYHELDGPTPGFGFLPAAHHYDQQMFLHLRLTESASLTRSELQEVLHRSAPDLPLLSYDRLDDSLSFSFLAQTIAAWVGGVLGLAALLLAAFGLYGVTTFQASRRRREIGVRLALGATPRRLVAWTLGRGLAAPAIGLLAGLVTAFAVSRLVRSLLIGVSATDLLTFVGVSVLLGTFCALATWIPARRAADLDPATTLRSE